MCMLEYMIISNRVVKSNMTNPHRIAHFEYLSMLKNEGKLQIAGRFSDGTGGMYILTVDSFEEAQRLADADPYHIYSIRKFKVFGWERKL